MARYIEMSLITSSVPAGEALTISQPISASHVNLVKLKVVPGMIGGTTRFQVYKRATFIDADNLYDTRDFEGSLIDPVLDYSDPMTDTPGATAERNEGPSIPYEDADGTSKLHIRIFNGDVNPKPYSVTAWYEIPVLVVGGVSTLSGIDILGPTPTLTFTDTTASAKGMKIVVEGDKAYVTEKAAALGTLWTYDLVNLRAGIGTSAPCSLLANTSVAVVGSDGIGPSPGALTWRSNQGGWTVGVAIDGSVANCSGMLIRAEPSTGYHIFKAESLSYTNTFIVTGDGRIGIAGTVGPTTVFIHADLRPSDYGLVVERGVTGPAPALFINSSGDDGATIESRSYSPNFGPNMTLLYQTTVAINLVTSAKGSIIQMFPRDFGAGQSGSVIEVGRNTNAGTPSAGYVNLINYAGTGSAVWVDGAGNLRIAGGAPSVVGDTGGVVVGTQISVREAKEIIRPITPADRMTAVEHLIDTPLYVYLLNNEVGAGFNHFHVGFIADEQPAWMMYDSNSIDEHRIEMELVIGWQDHETRLQALEAAQPGP